MTNQNERAMNVSRSLRRFAAQAIVSLIATTLVLLSAAHAADIDATSKIDAVQVFPSGAEVTRIAKVKLEAGAHTVVLGDLPAQALAGSIRVEGKATGNLRIGSVDSRRLFIAREDALRVAGERQALEDKIENLKDQRETLEGQIDAVEAQRALITNLSNLPNRPAPPNATTGGSGQEDWPQIMQFIGSSMVDISRSVLDAKVKIRAINREIADLEKKLSELVPRRTERTEIKISVDAQTPLEADLVVRYQVPRASWTPYYDARLSSGTKTTAPKLELTRRATITQHSGESWDNVAITLSTTRPTAGSAPPVLRTVTVDFVPEFRPPPPAPMAGAPADLAETEAAEADDRRAQFRTRAARKPAKRKVAVKRRSAQVETAPFQAVFKVPGRTSVASTGEAKRVQVAVDDLEPALSVHAVPRKDARAFLVAKIKIPKGAPLLGGTVSLIRDGTFVGTGKLPLLAGGEEHDLAFGIDDLVRVRHALIKDDKGETGLIASSRTQTRIFRFSLKNLHQRQIAFSVYGQMPSSKNKDIVVERLGSSAPSKTNVDDRRGVLVWEGKLKPDQEHEINFGYRVTWPGGKDIRYGR